MKGWMLAAIVLLSLSLSLAACRNEAAQMLETAQFEELQNNPEHARELYEAIVQDYPDSEQAAKARARLAEMRGGRP